MLRAGVEKGAGYVLQVPTEVGGGTLNLFTGNVGLSGIKIGNPPGYKSEHSIVVGDVSVAASVGSFMSDTIVIDKIAIKGPEITIDTKLTKTNLGEILDQVEKSTGGGKKPTEDTKGQSAASKKLKIQEITITDGKLRVANSALVGAGVAVPIPTIVIHDVGTGENKDETDMAGVLTRIIAEMLKAAGNVASQLPGEVGDLVKGAAKDAGGVLQKGAEGVLKGAGDAVKGIGDIFKKK